MRLSVLEQSFNLVTSFNPLTFISLARNNWVHWMLISSCHLAYLQRPYN